MPLVIPGITSTGDDKMKDQRQDWMVKLMGKKLTEEGAAGAGDQQNSFPKKDLPSNHRVVGEDSVVSTDHKPERLNVHVDKEGIVKDVKMG